MISPHPTVFGRRRGDRRFSPRAAAARRGAVGRGRRYHRLPDEAAFARFRAAGWKLVDYGDYDYLEGGAEGDPDIRYVAITDAELGRLHYGGIGRARLDPLLDTGSVGAMAASVAGHPDQPLRAVAVEGFSITPAPSSSMAAMPASWSWRCRASRSRRRCSNASPASCPPASGCSSCSSSSSPGPRPALEEPWRRLRRMMARLVDGRRLLWSGRHDRSELGMAMRLVNGILHRLGDGAARIGTLALVVDLAPAIDAMGRALDARILVLDRAGAPVRSSGGGFDAGLPGDVASVLPEGFDHTRPMLEERALDAGRFAYAPVLAVDVGGDRQGLDQLPLEFGNRVIDGTARRRAQQLSIMPCLIAAETARKDGRQLVLAGMNPIVRQVFEVSGFDRMLTIERDLQTARERHG